jgi:4a-hydroxytetrahydrobiopterin dehydratase
MAKKMIGNKCVPCQGESLPLTGPEISELLTQLDQWLLDETHQSINKTFSFKNFYTTMAFVNAIAWIAHRENHHPDLHVTYKTCKVTFSTHTVHGLSENDFICAKKVDELIL